MTILLGACANGAVSPNIVNIAEWRQIGDSVWSFDDHVTSAGPNELTGFLVSPRRFSDFTLEVDFWIDDDTNSGIFFRCGDSEKVADLNPDDCYEVNIWDKHPVQEFRTGSIVKHVVPTAEVHTIGKWNTLVVRAAGEVIEVSVNGVTTATMDSAQSRSGVIALQYAGKNQLRLRDLTITAD